MKNATALSLEEVLALDGGTPIRNSALPYGRQSIDANDIEAVVRVLQSDYLTCGPIVSLFENNFAAQVGAKGAVSLSNATAALHAAYHALGVREGDEVLVPAMTFAATSNAVLYNGGTPVFCDVDPNTLLLDPKDVKKKITKKTKGIAVVDYAGQPGDYESIRAIAKEHGLWILEDAAHSLGASYQGAKVGSFADCTIFSFHPVKHMTTGEGGMVTSPHAEILTKVAQFRNHGITSNHREREIQGTWAYEMHDLGYNYRLTDLQCALGLSQLKKLPGWIEKRQKIAATYREALKDSKLFHPLSVQNDRTHAYHLFVVQIDLKNATESRAKIYQALRAEGINVNVHYIPVYLHPYYQKTLKMGKGLCPNAETAYEKILSIPIFPSMKKEDVEDVIEALQKVERFYSKI